MALIVNQTNGERGRRALLACRATSCSVNPGFFIGGPPRRQDEPTSIH